MPSDRALEAALEAVRATKPAPPTNPSAWQAPVFQERLAKAILSAAATAHPDCREVVAELVAALDAFCRMPDAGLTVDDPRFEWWYETAEVRERAREAAKRFERALSAAATARPDREEDSIWEAAKSARFFLHTYLLGITHDKDRDPTGEGGELAAECLRDLQVAFEAHYGADKTPPICSGCSPIEPFERALGEGSGEESQ